MKTLMRKKLILVIVLCVCAIGLVFAIGHYHKKHVEKLAWEELYNEYLEAGFIPDKTKMQSEVADIEDARRLLKIFKASQQEKLDTTVHWVEATILE